MHNKLVEMVRTDCGEVIEPGVQMLEALKNQMLYITGGTGFVGTWLVETIAYLNDHHSFNTGVIVVSRDPNSFKEKAPHLAARKDIQLLAMDVQNIIDIPSDVSYIVHAAGSPDNRQHVSNPLGVMETITKGTNRVIEAALKLAGLKKIINLSSGQIYGKQREGLAAIPEDSVGTLNCNTITSAYPEAKRYAETLGCAYWSLYKIPVVNVRPFAFIGPYQYLDKPWAVNNFIRDALMNNTIRIIGNGLPMRSYMYPSDMAYWLLRILVDGHPGIAYNVGSPYGISLKDLAAKIKQYSNTKSAILIKDLNEDRSTFIPDDTLCRNSLGLVIKVNIDDTIKKSLAWFHKTLDR